MSLPSAQTVEILLFAQHISMSLSRIAIRRIIYTATPRETVGLLYLYLELCEASFWIFCKVLFHYKYISTLE